MHCIVNMSDLLATGGADLRVELRVIAAPVMLRDMGGFVATGRSRVVRVTFLSGVSFPHEAFHMTAH